MRRYTISAWTLALILAASAAALSQGNPRGLTKVTLNGQTVSIEYGRPSLKGSTVTEEMSRLKPGGFWRLGADKSTTLTTGTDLKFGDVTIPKGVYSVWAQRESGNSWKLVFNKQHGQWGTSHDPSRDFASAPLTATKASSSDRLLVIHLMPHGSDGAALVIHWGDMELTTHLTAG